MKKIAVIGVYGSGDNFTTGQAVKCHVLIDWMMKTYGTNEVTVVNTYQWKKNPIKLFISVLLAMSRCKNIIMLPAQNGVTVFAPLIYILNKIYERSIHYIVIGGWLPDMLKKKARLKHYLKYFDGIYVETKSMKRKLQADGMQNVYYMPNSREYVNIENIEEREFTVPVKLCTYSRVVKEKGIEDAIEICELANKKLNDKVFCIDIYGKIALDYKDQFLKILQNHRDITTYQGCKEPEETVNILMHYFALLFPTYYEGEGFAGTILDAFAARLPIVANDWKYNAEIIKNNVNGFIYPYRDIEVAAEQLVALYRNEHLYKKIQDGCKQSADIYSTDNVMKEFVSKLV